MSQPAIRVAAPAKVNLTLEVVGRRSDGYHDICSVMQAITLEDVLEIEPAADLRLACSDPALEGPENLVWKAAVALRQAAGGRRAPESAGAAMTLHKRIPVAAGLGGGSADAAAALLGLSRHWGLDWPRRRLAEVAATLGSDVPFFLAPGGCALAEGRGERLTPLPPLPPRWLLLVKPVAGIAAGAVYRAFPPGGWRDGSRTAAWLERAQRERTVPEPFNDLEAVALEVEPRAGAARAALRAAGAGRPVMSGSGSTYFALFEHEAAARAAQRALPEEAGLASFVAAFRDAAAGVVD